MHFRDYVITCARFRVCQYFPTICFIIILIENNSLIDDAKAKPWMGGLQGENNQEKNRKEKEQSWSE